MTLRQINLGELTRKPNESDPSGELDFPHLSVSFRTFFLRLKTHAHNGTTRIPTFHGGGSPIEKLG